MVTLVWLVRGECHACYVHVYTLQRYVGSLPQRQLCDEGSMTYNLPNEFVVLSYHFTASY